MRRYTILLLSLLVLIASYGCKSGCDSEPNVPRLESTQTLDKDVSAINDYAVANGLTLEEHSSGLRYTTEASGGTDKPDLCDQVLVNYKGYFLDGEVFDEGELTLGLDRVIVGWQIGIPLYGRGGKGKLFIPSYLAYGVNPTNGFPPNAPIAFDIEVINF